MYVLRFLCIHKLILEFRMLHGQTWCGCLWVTGTIWIIYFLIWKTSSQNCPIDCLTKQFLLDTALAEFDFQQNTCRSWPYLRLSISNIFFLILFEFFYSMSPASVSLLPILLATNSYLLWARNLMPEIMYEAHLIVVNEALLNFFCVLTIFVHYYI